MKKKHDLDESVHVGFIEMLTLLFIALKLTGYIDWPWVWVVSPLWLTLSVCVLLACLAVMIDWLLDVVHGDEEDEDEE